MGELGEINKFSHYNIRGGTTFNFTSRYTNRFNSVVEIESSLIMINMNNVTLYYW